MFFQQSTDKSLTSCLTLAVLLLWPTDLVLVCFHRQYSNYCDTFTSDCYFAATIPPGRVKLCTVAITYPRRVVGTGMGTGLETSSLPGLQPPRPIQDLLTSVDSEQPVFSEPNMHPGVPHTIWLRILRAT